MCWFAVGLHLFLRLALALCNQDRNCGKMNRESFLWWSWQVLSLYCWQWMASCLVRMAFLFVASFFEVSWNLWQALCLPSSSSQDSVPQGVLDVPVLFLPFIFAADILGSVHSWRKFVFVFCKSCLLFNYLCLSPFLSETSVQTQLSVSCCSVSSATILGCWDGVWTEI